MVMAQIYTIIGDYDSAIGELAYHLSIPGRSSPALLQADPIFAPLQNIPKFKALIRRYEQN